MMKIAVTISISDATVMRASTGRALTAAAITVAARITEAVKAATENEKS